MSIGYIIITPEELRNGIDLDLKIEEADKAMYRVKKKKKDGNAV
jgi:GGDEF domain-containing protein